MRHFPRMAVFVVSASIASGAAWSFVAPASAAPQGQFSFLEALPGSSVDVYIDGKLTLDNIEPGTLAGPTPLAVGQHLIKVTDPVDRSKVIGTALTLDVVAASNQTVVVHESATGMPVLTAYDNDLGPVHAGQARLTVRHVAAAGPVAVSASPTLVITPSLANPDQKVATVKRGNYTIGVKPASGGADLVSMLMPVPTRASTIVYVWGDAKAGVKLAVQTISGLGVMPIRVPAGEAGLANDSPAMPLWVMLGSLLGLAVAGVSFMRFRQL
jgi:hypothetical protein